MILKHRYQLSLFSKLKNEGSGMENVIIVNMAVHVDR